MFSENRGDVVLPTEVSLITAPEITRYGAIGLGTWNTRSSYSNVVVTKAGQTLYQSHFASGASGWRVYKGTWAATAGVYKQTANTTDCRSTTGGTDWSDYTITLSPVTMAILLDGPAFTHRFPPNSVTFLRIKTE